MFLLRPTMVQNSPTIFGTTSRYIKASFSVKTVSQGYYRTPPAVPECSLRSSVRPSFLAGHIVTPVPSSCQAPTMPTAHPRHRRWVFTSFLERIHFETLPGPSKDKINWLIAGSETCPDTQRSHVQGAIVLSNPISLPSLKKLLCDPAAHLEPMKGTPQQSEAYCSKEDPAPYSFGNIPEQGKRSDILALKESLESGATDQDLWSEHFPVMIKHDQAVKRYRLVMTAARDPATAPKIYIHTGPSGCGKTRAMPPSGPDVYWHSCSDKWWDGYCGQSTVIFDEFYGQLPYQQMLRILDRHPMTVETKGGTVQLTATIFYFTSNKDWQHWWLAAQEREHHPLDIASFVRRIEEFGTVTIYE